MYCDDGLNGRYHFSGSYPSLGTLYTSVWHTVRSKPTVHLTNHLVLCKGQVEAVIVCHNPILSYLPIGLHFILTGVWVVVTDTFQEQPYILSIPLNLVPVRRANRHHLPPTHSILPLSLSITMGVVHSYATFFTTSITVPFLSSIISPVCMSHTSIKWCVRGVFSLSYQ